VTDLRGKRVAVTRGTDPHIFLLRALDRFGLGTPDIKMVLLQHPDGKTALVRGDVDTIRKHLAALRRVPDARAAYIALVRSALGTLPVKNRDGIGKLLKKDFQFRVSVS